MPTKYALTSLTADEKHDVLIAWTMQEAESQRRRAHATAIQAASAAKEADEEYARKLAAVRAYRAAEKAKTSADVHFEKMHQATLAALNAYSPAGAASDVMNDVRRLIHAFVRKEMIDDFTPLPGAEWIVGPGSPKGHTGS